MQKKDPNHFQGFHESKKVSSRYKYARDILAIVQRKENFKYVHMECTMKYTVSPLYYLTKDIDTIIDSRGRWWGRGERGLGEAGNPAIFPPWIFPLYNTA
jgi:hypothetical protein